MIKRGIKFGQRMASRARQWSRLCLAASVTLVVPTNVRLWRKVANGGKPSWDGRNRVIAGFIHPGSSVLDLGCGPQTLKGHLKPGCRYLPSDVIKSSPDVVLCDLNAGIYPAVETRFDYVVCSGLFEYMRHPKEFLQRIPLLGQKVILSYSPLLPGDSKLQRLGNEWGWVNHFTTEELETLFVKSELRWELVHRDKLKYVIYILERVSQGSLRVEQNTGRSRIITKTVLQQRHFWKNTL